MAAKFSLDDLQRDSLNLPHCWVCERRFKTSVPPGPEHCEVHHICPRNAGGTDGPVVSLCDSHHTLIHKMANRLHTKKSNVSDLLFGEDARHTQKLLWLALMIVKSEQNVQDDPDKKFVGSVSLTRNETEMMKRLQSVTGKGRSELFRAGLFLLYQKVFKT